VGTFASNMGELMARAMTELKVMNLLMITLVDANNT
jgi:hypothetical protein